jgi:hypothetical protein
VNARTGAGDGAARVQAVDWDRVSADLDARGNAVIPGLVTAAECAALAGLYDQDGLFRSRVVMGRHGFGRGEYRYFSYPLPDIVAGLRSAAYPHLAQIANRWHDTLGVNAGFPREHARFLERCHAAGQVRPTPLLLQYGADDYNCLHQDLYGEAAFPLQLAAFLSPPESYEGGEFLLVEQRPRAQSIGHAIRPGQGEMVVFPTRERPVAGKRGAYRCQVRHGVSRIRAGRRYTLGVIFHDAR